MLSSFSCCSFCFFCVYFLFFASRVLFVILSFLHCTIPFSAPEHRRLRFLCFISWCGVTVKEDGKSRRELWQFRSGKWQNGEHKRRVEILCFSLSLQAVFVLIKFLPYPFCVTAQVSDRDKGSILPVSKNYVLQYFLINYFTLRYNLHELRFVFFLNFVCVLQWI